VRQYASDALTCTCAGRAGSSRSGAAGSVVQVNACYLLVLCTVSIYVDGFRVEVYLYHCELLQAAAKRKHASCVKHIVCNDVWPPPKKNRCLKVDTPDIPASAQ
jgi:hypothetical protein